MRKVVQWATGSVGRTALRRIIDHPDLQLVGLLVHDPKKVGLDAGDIAKRPKTGILATDSFEEILALDADVVIDASLISVPYEKQNDKIAKLLASGKNVISPNGFFLPDVQGEAYAGPLRAAALSGQATLAGIGFNPGFIAERLAVMVTGLVAKLDAIRCFEVVDASPSPSPGLIFDVMGFGADPAKMDVTKGPIAKLYNIYFAETLTYVAEALGTSLATMTPDHEVTLAPHDIPVKVGVLPRGTVAATTWRWQATFANGVKMTHSILWTSSPALHGETDEAHWRIEIDGRPNVRLSLALTDPDPAAPLSRPTMDATAALMIRAIPEVCDAAPGFFRLPVLAPYATRLG
ncbi:MULTISPECIES: hypothetical protein [unclassified Beijerinckia]|uniref:NAD(P)H-dependent amine dehydrogenase family protein n=1 Tax=unclassified Beijerinckia TaxID=2638183 RepID=UPI0008973B14|nr:MULTISPECIES: hypothetical protein [unclassified Beijerinckia]MDH7796298.1 hypothetical protein [Beijerinckia sp. GAS462]SEC38960.1 hypothetical protein SAMN05443249_2581 [Beijerinckia sp. 28-YEA-48]